MQTDIVIPFQPREPAISGTDEQRRPGRIEIRPNLVPLLRGFSSDGSASYSTMRESIHTDSDMASIFDDSEAEVPKPARGFVIALLLVVPFWVIGALVIYYPV